eukprot:COSAG05_NODE_2069_length_3614_cov_13.982646_1_plen_106_part_00
MSLNGGGRTAGTLYTLRYSDLRQLRALSEGIDAAVDSAIQLVRSNRPTMTAAAGSAEPDRSAGDADSTTNSSTYLRLFGCKTNINKTKQKHEKDLGRAVLVECLK